MTVSGIITKDRSECNCHDTPCCYSEARSPAFGQFSKVGLRNLIRQQGTHMEISVSREVFVKKSKL